MNIVAMAASPQSNQDRLAEGIRALTLNLDASQHTQLLAYIALMQKWNKVYNLTAIREPAQMITHHLLDSLAIVPFVAVSRQRILDVGCGPGLPGIPLSIACPSHSITLLDSNSKKTAFVRQAITELGLANADVVTDRIESWQSPQPFDLIVSRAFAELSDFVTQAEHLLSDGGQFMAMKGHYPKDEIDRLPARFRVARVEKLHVPQVDAERHLVFVEVDR